MPYTRYLPIVFIIVFALSGCGLFRKPDQAVTPESLYKAGSQQYQKGRYKSAIETFQRLTDEHPLSEQAVLAKLGIADAYFSNKGYLEAAQVYSEFIFLNPLNENLPYAMFQIGMCHYHQMGTIDRDQTETLKARQSFEALISRFPKSKFSPVAEKLLLETKQRLAEREFYVGMFYFKTKRYKAAAGRFEVVVKEYPNLGFDYKAGYLLEESRRLLAAAETENAKAPKKAPAGLKSE